MPLTYSQKQGGGVGKMDLSEKRCVPCEGGTPPLGENEIKEFMKAVPLWALKNGHLSRSFKFKNFLVAMDFVNSIARLAEEEGHHPDISIHYNRVDLELWTHAIKGLSENDFILAAKINRLMDKPNH
jgi:4a-hydroxytetrahydrobiopterin dehydratase